MKRNINKYWEVLYDISILPDKKYYISFWKPRMKILNSAEKIYKSQKQPPEVFYKKLFLKISQYSGPQVPGNRGRGEEVSPALF